jgi:hypothetical protein
MTRFIIAVTACALAGVAAVGCGSDDGPPAETPGAGGDPEGIALVERVNRYYGEAAELNLELRGGEGVGAVTGRYLLVEGEVRAAIVDLDPLTIVAIPAGSFIRLRGQDCWAREPAPSTQRFVFPLEDLDVSAPRPEGELVRVELIDRALGNGAPPIRLTVDPRTGRIATMGDPDLTTIVREVADPPTIPATTPLCEDPPAG